MNEIYLFLLDIGTMWERIIVTFRVLLFLFMKDILPPMRGSVDPLSSLMRLPNCTNILRANCWYVKITMRLYIHACMACTSNCKTDHLIKKKTGQKFKLVKISVHGFTSPTNGFTNKS